MTRKDLQEKYNIIGNNKDISLYRKKGEYDYGCGYCGNISLKNDKAYFNGNIYKDIDSLDTALREWEKSLPWPVDTYNPMMNKGAVVEQRIIWLLEEKMGFSKEWNDWELKYVKNFGPDSKISFKLERDLVNNTVTIVSGVWNNAFFTQTVDNAEDGVAMISEIVKDCAMIIAVDVINTLSVCPDTAVGSINAYVRNNANLLGWDKTDFKSLIIDMLEKQLTKLKA